ncbi:uncharacterized protein [Dermacentor andersoni]|uniref:uncharacterized protein isoform X2 n=1 Tax=Dermacentor andersoni TaxID=34620 RepID=UPI002416D1C3|nr:uncharacterized protein LOC126540873 isoform X2 [Dermacentor andersoni]
MMSAKLSKTVNLTAVSMALIKMRRRRRIVHSGASTPNKGVGSPDETKDGVQADADNDDDDDEDPEQLPFLLVAGAVVVALSILFLGIWTFNFIIAKALQALNGTEEMKLRHFLKDVMRACISKVARAYQSCVAFFANVTISGHLISMWKSAGMDTVTWMKVANFSQLFTLVVLSTLNNHLPSALSVDYDEHGTVDVYTGSPIEMNSINSDLISELIDEASSALELRYPWALTASVKRLDGAVRVFTQSARANMKSVRTVEKGALDLDAVGVRCVEFLHLQFNRALPTVMADDEETEDKVADTIVAIWKHVRGAALEWWNLSKGLELNKTVLRDHMSAVRIHTELEPVDTEEDPALEEPYSDDFLSNLVLSTRLTGHRINISQELGRLPLIRGQFEAVTLQPDFLYPMAPEPSVNYGTMGVMIAKLMFDSALQPASPHDGHRVQGQAEEAFGTCLASYAKEALNVTFEPTEWKVHARTKWAMEAAFLATRRNYNFVGKLVMDRFLFVRFGRTFCGDTYLSPLQFATKSSTLFATVFSCKRAREALC